MQIAVYFQIPGESQFPCCPTLHRPTLLWCGGYGVSSDYKPSWGFWFHTCWSKHPCLPISRLPFKWPRMVSTKLKRQTIDFDTSSFYGFETWNYTGQEPFCWRVNNNFSGVIWARWIQKWPSFFPIDFFRNIAKNVFFNMQTFKFVYFLHSHHMRKYWFYGKNHFWNFHQIFTLWDPLSQKWRFLQKCLSVCLSVVGRVWHNSR